jgi:hypothetical protein
MSLVSLKPFTLINLFLPFNMRPNRATRGKWRIPDGKVRERFVFMFGAPKFVGPASVD